jgi:hypothetical protein
MNNSRMTALGGRHMAGILLGATLAVVTSPAGYAQIGTAPVGTSGHAGRVQNAPEKPPEPAPDAIPGAKSRLPVVPATRPAGDMEPNDALFDAINRGDIASARDALARGADLNAVNILGMTPMELSVDLGRNDISFLLLSMRGEDSGRGSRALGRDVAPPVKTARGEKTVAGKSGPVRDIPVATKPVATPKLFANDGGTPMPSVGFLGFEPRSASN